MINDKTVFAVIPARGGSKELPKKNILPLAGKPLIVWTIDAANQSKYIDQCVISTDDEEIASISKENGGEVPFLRPKELALDETTTTAVLMQALNSLKHKYDLILLLQPTSPLRSATDIDNSLEYFMDRNAPSLISVTESSHPPEWSINLNNDHTFGHSAANLSSGKRRQDYKISYTINGAIYIAKTPFFISNKGFVSSSTIAYIMSKEKSIDIDNKLDFQLCEFLLKKHIPNTK